MVRGFKFRILEVEGLYYPCSENKGADQLRGHREADLRLCFRMYAKSRFSHKEAHMIYTPSGFKVLAIYGHGSHVGPEILYIFNIFVPPLPKKALHTILTLINKAASEKMIENNGHLGHIHK